MDLEKFATAARGMTRNPLGIIALFIVLVYGIAGLALGTTAEALTSGQKTTLVWFLSAFPFAVLFTFAWLVARHPGSLYGPRDYRSDEAYLKALDAARQIAKLDEEVDEVVEQERPAKRIPDAAETLTPGLTSREELRRNVVLSEDLALRELESEYATSINRQVALGRMAVDGAFAAGGRGYGVEVKYVRSPRLNSAAIRRQLEGLASSMVQSGWRNFGLVLVLVLDGVAPSSVENQLVDLEKFAADLTLGLETRTYDFAALCQKYGI